MQGLGQNNIEAIPTANVTMETDLSNSVSTLRSNFSNIYKTVQRLVEVQEKQIEIHKKHNDFMRKTFNNLIGCISQCNLLVLISFSMIAVMILISERKNIMVYWLFGSWHSSCNDSDLQSLNF